MPFSLGSAAAVCRYFMVAHGWSQFAKVLLTHKLSVWLSADAIQLLLNFLDEQKMMTVLKILNQHVSLNISDASLRPAAGLVAQQAVLGHQVSYSLCSLLQGGQRR